MSITKDSAASKFTPKEAELGSLTDMLNLADVSDDDLRAARDAWVNDPPAERFKGLIDAD